MKARAGATCSFYKYR